MKFGLNFYLCNQNMIPQFHFAVHENANTLAEPKYCLSQSCQCGIGWKKTTLDDVRSNGNVYVRWSVTWLVCLTRVCTCAIKI